MSANPAAKDGYIDTVVMSGGAPQSPLMAGFLYELLKKGKIFKKFHTSGAGALMALLAIAPKNNNPLRALRGWVEAGVADDVYAGMPVNFKLFHKPGPFSPLFKRMADRLKVPLSGETTASGPDPLKDLLAEWLATPRPRAPAWPKQPDAVDRFQDRIEKMWDGQADPARFEALRNRIDPIKRLRDRWLESWLKDDDKKRVYNDLVDLWFSAITPSTLTYKSRGLAAPLPFLEDLVSFDAAVEFGKKKGTHFCVNAYNMTEDARLTSEARAKRSHRNDKVMWIFETPLDSVKNKNQKHPLGPEHIRAAFSMPFIYPPARIGDDYFSEGADHQPINFHDLWEPSPEARQRKVALLDVLVKLEDLLVRTPRDLWDAYVISIMTPVVALAREDIDDFKHACEHDELGEEGAANHAAPPKKRPGRKKHGVELVHVDWKIPSEFQAYVMDWSYSNLKKLFEVGQEAGRNFVGNYTLPDYCEVFDGPVPDEHPEKSS